MEEEQAFRDLIAHFRAKAVHYNELADTIEREARELGYGMNKSVISPDVYVSGDVQRRNWSGRVSPFPTKPQSGEVTIDSLKAYLKRKKARIRDLSYHFGVPDEVIRKIVEAPLSGIIIGDRGWLTLDAQEPLFETEEVQEPQEAK